MKKIFKNDFEIGIKIAWNSISDFFEDKTFESNQNLFGPSEKFPIQEWNWNIADAGLRREGQLSFDEI